MHRQGGKFKGNPLPFQNDRRKSVFLYAVCKCKESVLKAASSGLVQIAEPSVRFPTGPEAEFPGHQGRNSEIGVQQEAIQLDLRIHLGQLFGKALLCFLQKGQPSCGGGRLVKKPRQNLPGCGHLCVHPAHTVDDPVLAVQQDQVGAAAHGLQHQRPVARLTEIIGHVQFNSHQPFQTRLGDLCHPCPHQMLAQQHTEHGRLCRIVPQQLRQLETGGISPGVQQKPLVAPQQ